MADKPRDWIADVAAIRRIFMSEWDPIGCDVPDDEYDSYIPAVYQLMRRGATAREISDRLSQIETVTMGLGNAKGMTDRNDRVANSLLKLMGCPE
jgi:hypothetical protein